MWFFEALLLAVGDGGFAPRPMRVPAEIFQVSVNPEPSGLAWAAPLARYLVVSDDTGLREAGTNHAPFVFAMSADGALDAEPVPIRGLDKLNDAESITPGPPGTFFLATSHSADKRGRVKPERCMLLQLALEGRALKVLGRVDLRTARTGEKSLLALADLDPAGLLDIEAIAFRDGALYIGLKSPLARSGSAVILKLADAARVVQAGRLPEGGVAPFLEVPLKVRGPDGSEVSQGIADLAFLADGSLVLAANSPKHAPADGGGALWLLRHPGAGPAHPAILRRFPGKKPEGVAPTPDGASLLVVFDENQNPPLWTELPAPR